MSLEILPRRPIRPNQFYKSESVDKPHSRRINDFRKSPTIGDHIREYCINTTLQGFRYIGDKDLSIVERVFFGFFFIIANMLIGYFISNVWIKWSVTPIIITYSAVATSIKDIPFPAITICSMNQAKASVATTLNETDIPFLNSLCSNDLEFGINVNYTRKWEAFPEFVAKTSPNCIEMLKYCRYGRKEFECLQSFKHILTDDGLCCIFNGVAAKYLVKDVSTQIDIPMEYEIHHELREVNWTPEHGYGSDDKRNVNPRVGAGTGDEMGLTVILNASADDYFCGSANSIGFKIVVHNPTVTPKVGDYGISIGVGWESRMIVTPQLSDASELVRDIPINERQCKFENEGNLTYYGTYSQTTCEMECETNLYVNLCDCLMYFMPKAKPNISICNNQHAECANYIDDLLGKGECNCYPACFDLHYKTDLLITRLADSDHNYTIETPKLSEIDKSLWRDNIAVVNIYYERSHFRRFTKEELIGLTEFIADTGGLLSLSVGYSIISLAEIIYFIFLRPFFEQRRRNKIDKIMIAPKLYNLIESEDQSCFRKIKSFISEKLCRKSQEGLQYPYYE